MLSVIQLCLTIYTSLYIHNCTSIDIQICNAFLSLSPPLTSTHCIILQLFSDCSVVVTSRMTGGSTTGWGERRSFSLLLITGEREMEKQMYIHSQSLERGRRRQDQNLNTRHTTWRKPSSSSKQDWHMDRMLPLTQETCADIVLSVLGYSAEIASSVLRDSADIALSVLRHSAETISSVLGNTAEIAVSLYVLGDCKQIQIVCHRGRSRYSIVCPRGLSTYGTCL